MQENDEFNPSISMAILTSLFMAGMTGILCVFFFFIRYKCSFEYKSMFWLIMELAVPVCLSGTTVIINMTGIILFIKAARKKGIPYKAFKWVYGTLEYDVLMFLGLLYIILCFK